MELAVDLEFVTNIETLLNTTFLFFYPILHNCGVDAADTFRLQLILSWTSSSVIWIAFMFLLTQSINLCYGLPLLVPGGTFCSVCFPKYSCSRLFTCPNHFSLAFLHLSVMFSTFSLSLMSSFLTLYLSVWPRAHLHIFIFVTSGFLT